MTSFLSKHKKFFINLCLIALISSLGVFVFGSEQAQARSVGSYLGEGLGRFFLFIQETLGKIVAWLSSLAQGILNFTNLQKAEMVQKGWKILRDLTNMFFVLILLVIALATILRLETYSMKQILWKLVVAALLINFSLVLAGAIIDFSGVLTNFFLQDKDVFFTDIATSMKITAILTTNAESQKEYWKCGVATNFTHYSSQAACESDCGYGLGNCSGPIQPPKVDWDKLAGQDIIWKVVGALFFSIIFTIIAAFVFGALAIMLLIRIFAIWFLLILTPIIWLFWVLPATKHLFEQWWKAFIKWVFFAPAAIFFIWLSISSWSSFIASTPGNEIIDEMNTTLAIDQVAKSNIMPNVMLPENLIQFVLVCGMLIGSLIVAQKMGIATAGGAIKLAKGAGKGMANWGGRKMQTWTAKPMATVGKGLQKGLGKVPGVRQIARPFRAFEERERAAFNKSEEKYKNRTTENLKMDYKAVDPRDKAAIGKILAGRGDFKADDKLGFTEKDIIKATALTKRYGQQKDIIKARPDLSDDIGKTIAGLGKGDMEKIQANALEGPNGEKVIREITKQLGTDGQWTGSHLAKMAETNQTVAIKIRQEVVEKNWDGLREDIQNYIESEAGKAILGNVKPKSKETPFSTA